MANKVVIFPLELTDSQTCKNLKQLTEKSIEVYHFGKKEDFEKLQKHSKAGIDGKLWTSESTSIERKVKRLKKLLTKIREKHPGITKGDVAFFIPPREEDHLASIHSMMSDIGLKGWIPKNTSVAETFRELAISQASCLVVNFKPEQGVYTQIRHMGWLGPASPKKQNSNISNPSPMVTSFKNLKEKTGATKKVRQKLSFTTNKKVTKKI